MIYPLVTDLAADGVPVAVTCRVLGFSKQGYYRWRASPVTERDWADAHLVNAALDIHIGDPAFGYRFIADELPEKGVTAGGNRVQRLCKDHGIWSVFSKKRGLNRKPGPPVHDDLVERDFTAAAPNELWLTDITEHPTGEGKLYLCAVKDVYSGRIVGYSMDARMKSSLAVAALESARIRRDARVEGLSIRGLAKRYQVGRDTVRQALSDPVPPARKTPERSSPRLDPFKPAIDAMLVEDTTAPRKQRHTARRVLARLIEEHGAEELSYSTVRDFVRVRRAQIDVEAGRRVEVFVPQEHAPGAEAEVDFGEVSIMLNGVKTKCYMFIFRLSYSGKAIHRIYPTQAQEAFLEGHVEAFNQIGGVPVKHIRYDNLTSAVRAVVFGQGRKRTENDRWVLFRSFYGFDPFYCQPGIAGAHEKGGVEGEVGWFRRNRLTPVPVVKSLEELNDRIRDREVQDNQRKIDGRIRTIGQDFATEAPFLAPLPAEEFDPGLVLNPRVDRSSMITVRMVKYSVPARFIGRRVRVSLRASKLVVFDGRTVVARHQRIVARSGQSVQLDHYLEVLKTKPGALPGSTALARARESGVFTSAHEAFWASSRRVNGDAEGTRELIDVLLLHRSMDAADIEAGITAALGVGAVSADVVAVEARRHAAEFGAGGGSGSDRHHGAHAEAKVQRVVSLTQRRLMDPAAVIAGLPRDTRPLPSVSAYDELLAKRSEHPAGTESKENISWARPHRQPPSPRPCAGGAA